MVIGASAQESMWPRAIGETTSRSSSKKTRVCCWALLGSEERISAQTALRQGIVTKVVPITNYVLRPLN
jgi:enoyl-CoA hydratase/carnithine racemase